MSIYLVVWILSGAGAAYFANKRGRDPAAWFVFGVLLGILSFILLYFLPDLSVSKKESSVVEVTLTPIEVVPMHWYYLDDNHVQMGPFTVGEIKELALKGVVLPSSYVWNETMRDWAHLEDVERDGSIFIKS